MFVIFAVTFVALVLLWGWFSSGLVLSSSREPLSALPRAFGLPFEDVAFTASDGTPLKGWFVPARRASSSAVILCHGRGACRSDILPSTRVLAEDHNLFYFDFRNHGESGGKATSLGRLEALDVEAALDWLLKNRPAQAVRVGIYGMSMGGAAAILAAARRPEIAAVAAESPFTSPTRSIVRFAGLFYNVPAWAVPYTLGWVRLRLGFDPESESPEKLVAKIAPRPLYLFQGAADVRMPPSEGEALFAAAGQPKELWTVPGADHGGLWEADPAAYEGRLAAFFKKYLL